MAPVTGIGGHFMRGSDREALAAWYAGALGMTFEAGDFACILPAGDEGYSVFAIFDEASEYIGDPQRQRAMVNLRVSDMDGVVSRLSEFGASPEPVSETEYGRFSWVTDPEGNRIELWEPR